MDRNSHLGAFQELRRDRVDKLTKAITDAVAEKCCNGSAIDPCELIYALSQVIFAIGEGAIRESERPAFDELRRQYEDAGKVRQVFRHATGGMTVFRVLASLLTNLRDDASALMGITTITSLRATEAQHGGAL